MIIKEFTVRSLQQAVAFTGDPTVEWFVEVLDSNYSAPTVKGISNGAITLVFTPDALNRKYRIAFHTAGESQLVKEIDQSIDEKRFWVGIMGKFKSEAWKTVKSLPRVMFICLIIGVGWALWDHFVFNTGNASYWYKEASIAGIKDRASDFIENSDENMAILRNKHNVYESEKIKEIENKYDDPMTEEKDFSFRSMFAYVGGGVFLMKDVINKDGEPVLMDQDEADDRCDMIDTYLPTADILKQYTSKFGIKERDDVPEWTSTNNGFGSDDYEVFMKDAEVFDGLYKEKGKFFVDGDDAKIGARCMFRAKDFE